MVVKGETAAILMDNRVALVHTNSMVVMACNFDHLDPLQTLTPIQAVSAAATVHIQLVAETLGLWQTLVLLQAATSAADNQVVVVDPCTTHLKHTEYLIQAFKLINRIHYCHTTATADASFSDLLM